MSSSSKSLPPLVHALRSGRRSPVEHARTCCDRLDAIDSGIDAFAPEPQRRDRVLEAATALESRALDPAARGPLFGVPIGIKDVFRVDGVATKAGSEFPAEALAGPEAALVTRLRAAGALVLGKTRTAEFACFDPPATRNPHDHDHTPGGSSSGSAAAVAAGLCPLALGTQTVGSTLRPAAFCGIVGFKPTFDRLPVAGVVPVAESLDHVGLFTRTVAGMESVARVCFSEWIPESPALLERPTIGVPDGPYLDRATPEGRTAFADQLERLETAGYAIERVPMFDGFESIENRHTALMSAELAIVHGERGWFERYGDRYADVTADLIETGRATTAGTIADARAKRGALRESIAEVMDRRGIDLWASPAAPGSAPKGIESTGDPIMNLPWTYAGLPAVSIPAGTIEGLPVGLQCVARAMDDERLLAWAAGIEATLAER